MLFHQREDQPDERLQLVIHIQRVCYLRRCLTVIPRTEIHENPPPIDRSHKRGHYSQSVICRLLEIKVTRNPIPLFPRDSYTICVR